METGNIIGPVAGLIIAGVTLFFAITSGPSRFEEALRADMMAASASEKVVDVRKLRKAKRFKKQNSKRARSRYRCTN